METNHGDAWPARARRMARSTLGWGALGLLVVTAEVLGVLGFCLVSITCFAGLAAYIEQFASSSVLRAGDASLGLRMTFGAVVFLVTVSSVLVNMAKIEVASAGSKRAYFKASYCFMRAAMLLVALVAGFFSLTTPISNKLAANAIQLWKWKTSLGEMVLIGMAVCGLGAMVHVMSGVEAFFSSDAKPN